MPNIIVSKTEGESLLRPDQNDSNIELLVYTRRKHHLKSPRQPVTLGNDQSQPSGIGPANITGIFNPYSSSIPIIFPSKESSALNILVAIRKGI